MFNLIGKAYALDPPTITPIAEGTTDLTEIVAVVIDWVLYFGGAIAVIFLIYGGILYITAGGDAEKASKGKTAVVNAVIGIIIIFLALVIVQWAQDAIFRVR